MFFMAHHVDFGSFCTKISKYDLCDIADLFGYFHEGS